MDAGKISSDALKYPINDFKKVLIVGIITILSSLIIPGFLLLGYLLKIIKCSMNGISELPEFNQWTRMFTDGLMVFVVLFVYSLIPMVLIFLGMGAALLPLFTTPGAGTLFDTSLSLGLISGLALVGIVLEIVVSFIIFIALGNMAYYGELGAAFRFKEIFGKIGEIGWVDYFIWYVMMLFIVWIAWMFSFFLVFPLFIGIILVPLIIAPYLMMFLARSTALIYVYGGSDDYLRAR